jgi:hypothetical protein
MKGGSLGDLYAENMRTGSKGKGSEGILTNKGALEGGAVQHRESWLLLL